VLRSAAGRFFSKAPGSMADVVNKLNARQQDALILRTMLFLLDADDLAELHP
jgi:hypothetical protein